MIQRYQRASLTWGVPGAVLQVLGGVIHATQHMWSPEGAVTTIGYPILILGTLFLLMGLANYAKAKGRSTAWCLFALLGVLGWIVLTIVLSNLKDRASDERGTSQPDGSTVPAEGAPSAVQ